MDNFKCCHHDSCGQRGVFEECEFYNNPCYFDCDECEHYNDSYYCDNCEHNEVRDGWKEPEEEAENTYY